MSLLDYAGHGIPWVPGQGEFDPMGYVGALSPDQLMQIIEFGADVPAEHARAVNAAARQRFQDLSPRNQPDQNGMGDNGAPRAPTNTDDWSGSSTHDISGQQTDAARRAEIEGMYRLIFGRDALPEGVDYWASDAHAGWDRDTLMQTIAQAGAQNGETITDWAYNQGLVDRPAQGVTLPLPTDGPPNDMPVQQPAPQPTMDYNPAQGTAGQIQIPDYGIPSPRETLPLSAMPPSIRPGVGPASGMDNFNNAAHSTWTSQYQDMMQGQEQDTLRQARNQGLLNTDQYVGIRGLLG